MIFVALGRRETGPGHASQPETGALRGYIMRVMTRELLILRHAKSAWDTGAPTDFERPLSERGQSAAPRVGRFLFEKGLVPDFVVSSPAERAKQTVMAVCAQMDLGPETIHWDDRIYGGWTSSLMSVLRESPPDAHRVLIAGHNPGLEGLLEHLCEQRVPYSSDGKMLPTAALAHLLIRPGWDELDRGCAELLSITRSRSLTDY